ncbi:MULTISPECIES: hypothetical protein [Enterobacteriaceae]|uniref:hypothetical protein n=2 Tax=Enterobacterales TaxID=91347 RepID=UPI003704933D
MNKFNVEVIMAIPRLCLFLIIIVLLAWGATGLNAKESIAFTIFGLEVPVIVCSSIGIVVVRAVCCFVFEEPRAFFTKMPGAYRKIAAGLISVALWNLIFTVMLQYGKPLTILGFHFYYFPAICIYILTLVLSLSAVGWIFFAVSKKSYN